MKLTAKIREFIEKYKITDYTINPDGMIDAGSIFCAGEKLTSLVGAPSHMCGNFYCHDNLLTSLEGAPKVIDGNFSCGDNQLTSLKGSPEIVSGVFYCNNNNLTNLIGSPHYVGKAFVCKFNKLTSLEGIPSTINSYIDCNSNQLTSLHNVHKHIKELNGIFYCFNNPIESSVLGLLLIKGIKGVFFDNKKIEKILNKYIMFKQGREKVIDAQQELLDAGLDEYARL